VRISRDINEFFSLFLLPIIFLVPKMCLLWRAISQGSVISTYVRQEPSKNLKTTGKEERAMSEQEKQEFYFATCRCCLIAEALKTCFLCQFKIGLTEQEQPFNSIAISLPLQTQVTLLAVPE
jgi:hypothetical protein